MNHLTVEQAAGRAQVSVDVVMNLIRTGLLESVQKDGLTFLAASEVYKLRFILYLQKEHHLPVDEIEHILRTQRPPYSHWREGVGAAGVGSPKYQVN
jgi:hypothetical protein